MEHVQNTEMHREEPHDFEEEEKENFQLTINMLKDIILQKDQEIQVISKELQTLKNDDKVSNNETDLRSRDNSMNFTGEENLKDKLEKAKKRLKQYRQENDSAMQQVSPSLKRIQY